MRFTSIALCLSLAASTALATPALHSAAQARDNSQQSSGNSNVCVGAACDCSDPTLSVCAAGLNGTGNAVGGLGQTVNCDGNTCTTIIVSGSGASKSTTTLTGSRTSSGPTATVTSGSGSDNVSADTGPNGQTTVTVSGKGDGAISFGPGAALGVTAASLAGMLFLAL